MSKTFGESQFLFNFDRFRLNFQHVEGKNSTSYQLKYVMSENYKRVLELLFFTVKSTKKLFNLNSGVFFGICCGIKTSVTALFQEAFPFEKFQGHHKLVNTRTYPLRLGFSVETKTGKLSTSFTRYCNPNSYC